MPDKTLKLLFCMIFLFAILPLVSSAPPFQSSQTTINFDEGLIIVDNLQMYLTQNQDYQKNFFVYNKSNGVLMDNSTINCTLYVANSSGEVLIYANVPYFSNGHWGIDLLGGNFSSCGNYAYGLKCEDGGFGGSTVGLWVVTPNGQDADVGTAVFYIGLLAILVLFFFGTFYVFMETDNLLAKVGMIGFGHLLLIAITFIAWNMAGDFITSSPFLIDMLRILFFVLIVATFPLLIGGFVWYFLMLWKIKDIERLMSKGISYEEAERRQGKKYK